jgi:phage baseplate assembly protein W
MAFEVKRIDPIDLQPRKAVGVSLPFSGKSVFNSTYQSKDAIKTNIINYFLTARGERYLNPTFGNGLRALLFDQLTEEKTLQIDKQIRDDISIYFPKVIPTEISTVGVPDSNTVQFTLKYQIADSNIDDEVIINFEQ